MSKKTIAPLICVTAALCCMLTSCNSHTGEIQSVASSSSANEEISDYTLCSDLTEDEITLTVWESADGIDEWIKKAGESFNKLYPNIKIDYKTVEIDRVVKTLDNRDLDMVRPDLFGAPHDCIGTLIEKDYIIPVESPEEISSRTLSTACNAMFYQGTMYGYPTSCETYALYYNKNLIDENDIPSTWDEIIEYSKSFDEIFPDKTSFIFDNENMYYVSSLMTNGGAHLFPDSKTTGLLSGSAVSGVQLLQKLIDILPENIKEYTSDDFDRMFLQGDAAMYISGPWLLAPAKTAGLDFGVTTLPAFSENSSPAHSFSGVRGMFVSTFSTHPKEAAEFAKYLITNEMQELRQEITGALPSVNIAADNEYANAFIEQLAYSYPMPKHPGMNDFWEYGETFCQAMYDKPDAREELEKFNSYLLTGSTDITAFSEDIQTTAFITE